MRIDGPRQVVLITSKARIGLITRENIFPADWHMPVSFKPKLHAIAVGKKRFSHKTISKSKIFVINFISKACEDIVKKCGSTSGKDINKFEYFGLQRIPAKKVNCPRLKKALGWKECNVIKAVDAGDHTIFIGKVVYEESAKEGKRLFHKGGMLFTTTA